MTEQLEYAQGQVVAQVNELCDVVEEMDKSIGSLEERLSSVLGAPYATTPELNSSGTKSELVPLANNIGTTVITMRRLLARLNEIRHRVEL